MIQNPLTRNLSEGNPLIGVTAPLIQRRERMAHMNDDGTINMAARIEGSTGATNRMAHIQGRVTDAQRTRAAMLGVQVINTYYGAMLIDVPVRPPAFN